MKKHIVVNVLRKLRIAKVADKMRFYYFKVKNRRKNALFLKEHPQVRLPSDYTMYESFQLDYSKYYNGGREHARSIIDSAKPYVVFDNVNILDWGCGPARVIRHFPQILGDRNTYYGTDYNPKTIEWCSKTFDNIIFSVNDLRPPLNYVDEHFHFIYGISVVTHLSEENQSLWIKELNRILNSNGILYLTTSGSAFKEKLSEKESKLFDDNEIISRGEVTEGHRMYSAFHPPNKMRSLVAQGGFKVMEHIPGRRVHESYISQDIWILQKQA